LRYVKRLWIEKGLKLEVSYTMVVTRSDYFFAYWQQLPEIILRPKLSQKKWQNDVLASDTALRTALSY